MIWSNSASDSNDWIDEILAFMVKMSKNMEKLTGTVDKLTDKVNKLADTDEISVRKIVKLEDAVQKIVKREGEMNSNIEDMKSKVDEIGIDASVRYPFGWKYYGRGTITHYC